ncbi:MAG: PHP domain-containing protein, partial [Clostridia bacterium]|nr:PHP domain-containing protein [Clostridia bacterium]
MKTVRKITAVICVLLLAGGIFGICVNAENGDVDYTVNNPYADVNWKTVKQFKADLHSHTTASDGNNTLKEMTEAHYDKGFDIVAVTDHGVTDYGWTKANTIPAMKVVVVAFKDRPAFIQVLDENGGEAGNGNTYSLVTKNGDDYYYQTDGEGTQGKYMMRVPYGIENNPSSINNAHVNSWFADYGNGRMGGTSDYVTPIAGVDRLGGLSVINHPGEYTNARDEVYTEDAYNEKNISYKYIIQKFAGILMNYDTCIGIDCNSKGDSRTRFDRKLWDILLQKVVPSGRNVF